MLHVIESVRHRNGDVHERELRRKGHRVRIDNLHVGERLFLTYVDDDNKVLLTSTVENVLVGEGTLVVWTQNTEYTFIKEAEAAITQ